MLDDATGHAQVRPLLPGTAGCLVLVTSRHRLIALDGAQPLPLDTLPPDQAIELFTRLARRPQDGSDAAPPPSWPDYAITCRWPSPCSPAAWLTIPAGTSPPTPPTSPPPRTASPS